MGAFADILRRLHRVFSVEPETKPVMRVDVAGGAVVDIGGMELRLSAPAGALLLDLGEKTLEGIVADLNDAFPETKPVFVRDSVATHPDTEEEVGVGVPRFRTGGGIYVFREDGSVSGEFLSVSPGLTPTSGTVEIVAESKRAFEGLTTEEGEPFMAADPSGGHEAYTARRT